MNKSKVKVLKVIFNGRDPSDSRSWRWVHKKQHRCR